MLTCQTCAVHIIARGLVRVRCVQEMDRVLHFMTRKGLINTGVLAVKRPLLPVRYGAVSVLVLTVPPTPLVYSVRKKESHASSLQRKVIVVGAGASGLAAARQLQNFGTQVSAVVPCRTSLPPPHACSSQRCCTRFTGGGAGGEGEDRRPRVGRCIAGCHGGTRSSNSQRLRQQPHRPHV